MRDPAIVARNLGKRYVLGQISRKTLADEVAYAWHRLRGRDPHAHMAPVTAMAATIRQRSPEAERHGVREFWALRDVSFEIGRGEVLGIVGRNGAGKSTLLKILSRITAPTEGEAWMDGRVGALLEVGTGFHPELTGRENVFLNGTILGMKRREVEAKFEAILAFSEIEQFIDTPVKRYSSGMYVRLAFAVAAHLNPEILIVDEVLAVGDLAFQRKCLGYMGTVAESGRTVLFVSHNLGAVRNMCTRALWISEGRIAGDGPVEEIVRAYQAEAEMAVTPTDGLVVRPAGDVLAGKTTWVQALRLGRPDGTPCQRFKFGEDVRLDFQLAGQPAREGCGLLWVLQDVWGTNLGWSDSARLCGYRLRQGQMSGSCTIHNLPLTTGRYYLTVTCGIAGAGEAKDLWQKAMHFDVVESDPFGTHNEVPSSTLGSVIFQQSWGDTPAA